MMLSYEIAVVFWGAVWVLGLVLAVLGGVVDATLRAARRAREGGVQSQAPRVTVTAPQSSPA